MSEEQQKRFEWWHHKRDQRVCARCLQRLPAGSRAGRQTCSVACKQALYRERISLAAGRVPGRRGRPPKPPKNLSENPQVQTEAVTVSPLTDLETPR